jgi:hypothetical protein
MLADQRATDYKSWYEVGQVLFNIANASVDGLDTWTEFSKRTVARNFSEATCIARWKKMKKTDSGVGTLIYYAKIDCPDNYEKFKQNHSRKSIIDSIKKNGQLTSYACAEALYHKCGKEFVYTGTGKDGWYQFGNHRWNQIAEGIELRKLIPTLRDPIMEELKKLREKMSEVENERREKEDENEETDDEVKKYKEHEKTRMVLLKEKNKE